MAKKKKAKQKKRARPPKPNVPDTVGLTKKEALMPHFHREQKKAKRMVKGYKSPLLLYYEKHIPTGP